MPAQQQVAVKPATGVPGSKADMNNASYYPQTLVAETPITIGSFVWLGSNKETHASYAASSETSCPIGLVERNGIYQESNNEETSATIAAGLPLTVATDGSFFVTTTTNATAGQTVFALFADGTIATAEKGATVKNAVSTDWVVSTGNTAGNIIIIKRS